jgi:hypothetical protein
MKKITLKKINRIKKAIEIIENTKTELYNQLEFDYRIMLYDGVTALKKSIKIYEKE